MADKILRWDEFQEYHVALKNYMDTADGKAIKKIHFDDASRTIKFFKDENADTGTAGDFSVIIPDDVDTTDLVEKLQGAVDGNIIVANADGSIRDGGVALTDLATKAEVTELSNTKIGNLDDLTTTEKTSIVGAINEIDGQVAALQAGTYDDSELRNMIGTLTGLSTNAKDNLVNAINEVDAELGTAKTEAVVTVEEDALNPDFAKVYTIKQNGQEVGKVNIPKDMVVQSGQIVTDPVDQAPGKYLELTIANGNGDKVYIAIADLAAAYTVAQTAPQVQLAISPTNEISATIVAGSVTATELGANAVTTDKILDANVTYAKLATDVTTAFDTAGSATAAETNAKAHADGLNTAMDARVTALEGQFTFATSDDINGLF